VKKYDPMLAVLVPEPFDSDAYLYEPKLDGMRAVAYIEGGKKTIINRYGRDVTDKFPEIDIQIRTDQAVLDGELVCLDEEGIPRFHKMQTRMNRTKLDGIKRAAEANPAAFAVFDILERGGKAVLDMSLVYRKEVLDTTLRETHNMYPLMWQVGDGVDYFKGLTALGWEGIMAKRLDSTYIEGGRTKAWVKLKNRRTTEVYIAGCTRGTGRRQPYFGALFLGRWEGGELIHCGQVGTGFTDKELAEYLAMLEALKVDFCPFMKRPSRPAMVWCKPAMKCRVSYLDISEGGMLRDPAFVTMLDSDELVESKEFNQL